MHERSFAFIAEQGWGFQALTLDEKTFFKPTTLGGQMSFKLDHIVIYFSTV